MASPTLPNALSIARCRRVDRPAWQDPRAGDQGSSLGSFAITTVGWTALLLFFIWFAGFLHVDGAGVRVSWSAIASSNVGSSTGHEIARFGGKTLAIGPYESSLLPATRCLAASLSLALAVAAMRFIALPLSWRVLDHATRLRTRAAANSLCAQAMGALVIWWVVGATILFLAALALPPDGLAAVRFAARAWIGGVSVCGPIVIVAIQGQCVMGISADGSAPSRTVVIAVQALAGWVALVGVVFLGAALSLEADPTAS